MVELRNEDGRTFQNFMRMHTNISTNLCIMHNFIVFLSFISSIITEYIHIIIDKCVIESLIAVSSL